MIFLLISHAVLLAQLPQVLQLRVRPPAVHRLHLLCRFYLRRQSPVRVHFHSPRLALASPLELDADEPPVLALRFFVVPQVRVQRLELLDRGLAALSLDDHAALCPELELAPHAVGLLLFEFLLLGVEVVVLEVDILEALELFEFLLLTAPAEGPARTDPAGGGLVLEVPDFGFGETVFDGFPDLFFLLRERGRLGRSCIEPRTLLAEVTPRGHRPGVVVRLGFLELLLGVEEGVVPAQCIHECLLPII